MPIREELITNTSSLIFDPVLFGDEGDYYCNATSREEVAKTQDATLTGNNYCINSHARCKQYYCVLYYAVGPFATIAPMYINQAYHRNDTAVIMCASLGNLDNTWQWLVNDSVIPEQTTETLTLTDVDASTGGIYTCVVTNAAGNDSASTFLFIAPYFIIEPVDAETQNGSLVTLLCVAEAFPSPSYQWARTDGLLVRDELITVRDTLTFNPVRLVMKGDYFCSATSRQEVANSMDATLAGSTCGVLFQDYNVNLLCVFLLKWSLLLILRLCQSIGHIIVVTLP